MPRPRLVLVADDQRLANAIQTRLVQALGRPALLCRTDSCRDHFGPQTDGLLLLALTLPCDPEPVQYLVQEVRLVLLERGARKRAIEAEDLHGCAPSSG